MFGSGCVFLLLLLLLRPIFGPNRIGSGRVFPVGPIFGPNVFFACSSKMADQVSPTWLHWLGLPGSCGQMGTHSRFTKSPKKRFHRSLPIIRGLD